MSAQELKIATEMISKSKKKYLIEASGVREENIKEVSKTGVEFISMSSLVRRARYIDVSMKVLN
jgi:nicotinate-nucleotide pyrophosphorylase (carboxylating)